MKASRCRMRECARASPWLCGECKLTRKPTFSQRSTWLPASAIDRLFYPRWACSGTYTVASPRLEAAGLLAGPVGNAGVFFRQPEVGHCYFQVQQPNNLRAADRRPRSAARCGRGRADPASAKPGATAVCAGIGAPWVEIAALMRARGVHRVCELLTGVDVELAVDSAEVGLDGLA